MDSDFELDIFDVADAADMPADGDDLADDIGFEGVLGAETFVEGVLKRIEFLLVFRGDSDIRVNNIVLMDEKLSRSDFGLRLHQ